MLTIKKTIFGVPCFQVTTEDKAKEHIKELIRDKIGGYSVAINAEKILMYSKDNIMKEIINNSLLPIPDGSGAVLGLYLLYDIKSIRLDLPKIIFELSNQESYKMFILGSSEQTNMDAVKKLNSKYPNINIVGRNSGYFTNENMIIELLTVTKPQIVMVGLGSPKQEIFASRMSKIFPHIIFIGCGGALDILAGNIKRAPKIFQDNHLEWFYRLISQPSRIKRQKILPIYAYKLLSTKLKNHVI